MPHCPQCCMWMCASPVCFVFGDLKDFDWATWSDLRRFQLKLGIQSQRDTLLGILAQVEINHLGILNIFRNRIRSLCSWQSFVWYEFDFKDLAKELYIVPWFWAHARPKGRTTDCFTLNKCHNDVVIQWFSCSNATRMGSTHRVK